MAPPPEYDKEPKAPDKSVTSNSTEESKLVYNHIKDQSANTEHKTTTAVGNVDVENNKHVEALDDGQLRALLDEAITYKCPKDREGKSSLFKELLEEVEQDEQACEAAARLGAGRNNRRGRAHREHHSSLQDLVAAMAGEAAPRRGRAHAHSHAPAPPAGNVSARALHGGSLPSGVDTSFLLGEEAGVGVGVGAGARGGYLATVRCVNPPPLAERRVSTGDANAPQPQQPPQDLDVITRRSKPMFPMTYTARATLEIGSGSVCSGRAVTTTTASNQVRTPSAPSARSLPSNQAKLMNALCASLNKSPGGGATDGVITERRVHSRKRGKRPRGPAPTNRQSENCNTKNITEKHNTEETSDVWINSVNNWYKNLDRYSHHTGYKNVNKFTKAFCGIGQNADLSSNINIFDNNIQTIKPASKDICNYDMKDSNKNCKSLRLKDKSKDKLNCDNTEIKLDNNNDDDQSDIILRKQYRERVGYNLVPPTKVTSPRYIRKSTIAKPLCTTNIASKVEQPITECHKNLKSNKKLPKVDPMFNLKETVQDKELETDNLSTINLPTENTKNTKNDINSDIEMINKSYLVETLKTEIELVEIPNYCEATVESDSFLEYVATQKKLMKKLEINNNEDISNNCYRNTDTDNKLNDTTSLKEADSKIKYLKLDEKNNISTNYATEVISTTSKSDVNTVSSSKSVVADLPNNAYILLTFPKSFLSNSSTTNEPSSKIKEIVSGNTTNTTDCSENNANKKNKKKLKQQKASNVSMDITNKNLLKMLLYSDSPEDTNSVIQKKLSSYKEKEVDSAIPFSCITTPEVVASCNTTSSTAVAIDPKPLQLVSSYRAVACLMDGAFPPRAPSPPHAAPAAPAHPTSPVQQPRGAAASALGGLPLARPAPAAEYKKSLDENGNAVQGFGSPLSGSSQQKKPRRKKTSKNETVIKSHQIDGYQGNKDIDEVLRFIESNAETARAPKLRKHKDDDDKGKKRSGERRKDKGGEPKRASSLEELSRTTLADLTCEPPPGAKPERRSWGADARALLEPDPPELADFQTVTKKRRARRRADERAPSPPRRRAPSPARAPASAPASERSNDSNDDTDCAHSPPPAPAPPPACASYADIARTRHNIPDLIESCNFYAEGDERPAAPAADAYPALAARRAPDEPAEPRARKEPAAPPAPDVVADRRPPVVLLAAGARPRDMDGVTFGFDVNEQLLGARCDLLAHGAVPVRAGCAALRYVPPAPPAPRLAARLHQIVDYVAAAWEDAIRGGSKVHYFSECAARNN
ncbi:uncharacterized protein LOC112055358 isoform X2 [Bicyclus anynana]|uniref:Uncharacterized protein LOC112055358 isoform X2 n=1 Tax=Bicyclus anynana TaxID=110368 RepID=A0ABM3LIS4_BICAN|nr:uncharacterized protein LOC112055358 isoform X2 [Bicyclus anynana]